MNNVNNRKYKILCIDDDVIFIEKTKLDLEKISKNQFDVHIINNPLEAIKLITETKEVFDCILLDYLMPEMDGIEFLTDLRHKTVNANFKTPIIFLTNHGDESLAVRALKLGAADYFIKSRISVELLKEIILSTIQKYSALIEVADDAHEIILYQDPLTHSLNRDGFLFFLEKKLVDIKNHTAKLLRKDESKEVVGVLCLNVDNFKFVNSYGHHVGDILLIDIVRILFGIVPSGSNIARLSGDTFAILMTTFDGYYEVGEWGMKIQRSLSRSYDINKHKIFIKVKIGISCYPQDGENAEDLLQKAEIALSNIKKEEKSLVNYFSSYMLDDFNRKNTIIEGLRSSLDRNEMELVYQPIVDGVNKTIVAAEALLRWKSVRLGDISPSEFISIAESAGLAIKIGNWVLMKAVESLSAWRRAHKVSEDFVMSINVSLLQFIDDRFYNYVKDLLKGYKVPEKCLQLEVTETQAYELWKNKEIALQFFELEQSGIKIAIDDFGTGFSSFARLSDLPISTLKIDKYFVDGILKDNRESSIAILKSILDLGKNLGLRVVAEGIETKEQMKFLLDNDCPILQGYLISHPLSEKDFNVFLDKGVSKLD